MNAQAAEGGGGEPLPGRRTRAIQPAGRSLRSPSQDRQPLAISPPARSSSPPATHTLIYVHRACSFLAALADER